MAEQQTQVQREHVYRVDRVEDLEVLRGKLVYSDGLDIRDGVALYTGPVDTTGKISHEFIARDAIEDDLIKVYVLPDESFETRGGNVPLSGNMSVGHYKGENILYGLFDVELRRHNR